MSEKWRSAKAKKQLRDRFGRWISLGANVRYRGDGAEQSGTVKNVVDGKAYVEQKNADGSVSQKIVDPGAIRVIASKATLATGTEKYFDKDNNFTAALRNPTYTSMLERKKKAGIERADGYLLTAELIDEDASNPVLYQLYAPGGRSLGSYGVAAESDFDDMVLEDQAGQEGDTAPEGGEAAPAAVAASLSADIIVSGDPAKTYRVPQSVKTIISSAIDQGHISLPKDLDHASALAYNDTVSFSNVEWIGRYFESIELDEKIRGGYEGRKWASKIISPKEEEVIEAGHPKYLFNDDEFAYFAVGSDSGSTLVNRLLSVDYETGEVFAWTPEGFSLIPDLDMTEVDEPQIIPIDEMTADEFAHWLDSGTSEEFDILDTNPEERNLFTLAESEIDFDELDRSFAIIAAGEAYTPVERAQNAKAQRRGSGGKFGSEPDAPTAPVEGTEPKVQKARLPVALPLVANPAARIAEWLSQAAEAPVVAAGEAVEASDYPAEDQALEDSATGPTNEALYFAIVDEIDKTSVLDAIAIVKQNGQPSAFIRSMGVWKADPDTLTLLQGSTPPAVVELADPETVKTVLTQIDAHDAQEAPAPETAAPLAASGFAMADGTYTIINVDDLKAVVASAATGDIFVKAHVRKRARALNRMDLVPADWREFSLPEIGELSAASKSLYGEYGEILVASGVPGVADTPGDFKNVMKLQAYWTTGKGALKIRWGTKGDLTRAHRHLSKYVGPQRAWGLAQKYHKSLFGVYNYTHDVATGQYSPRRKR